MKLLALLLASSVVAFANPSKAPLTKYSTLWTNSPFTSKPPIEDGPPPGPNPLEDYALGGITPITGGYRVTLLNRKDPEERVTIDTHRKNQEHGFEVVSVDRKPGDPLATVVHLSKGTNKGTVEFDTALLTLKAPPAPAPQQPQARPGTPPIPGQPQPGNPNDPRAQIRNRVVQPPVPTPAAPTAPANTRGPTTTTGGRDSRDSRGGRR